MSSEPLQALAATADALYQARLAQLRSVLAEEARLRRELADLDTHRLRNAHLPATELAGLRAIGGDMLWQGWVDRMQAELNMQLAKVLVRKAAEMDALRRAFGKAEAAEGLVARHRNARQAARRSAETGRLQDLVQMRAFTRPDAPDR